MIKAITNHLSWMTPTSMPPILNLAMLPFLGKRSSRKVSLSLMYPPLGNLASGPGAADGIDIIEVLVLGVFNRSLSNIF